MPEKKPLAEPASRRAHLANERTFLAWVRTSVGIMAFGFVVENFSIFIKKFQADISGQAMPSEGFSQPAGIALVASGMLITFFAYLRYRNTEKQIDEGTYAPNALLITALTFFVMAVGAALIVYLVWSV